MTITYRLRHAACSVFGAISAAFWLLLELFLAALAVLFKGKRALDAVQERDGNLKH